MNLSRLSALLVLLTAFGLAACGNKADLFMPPPPDDDELIETGDAWDEPVEEEQIEGGNGLPEADGVLLPPPAVDGDGSGPPLPDPAGDE